MLGRVDGLRVVTRLRWRGADGLPAIAATLADAAVLADLEVP